MERILIAVSKVDLKLDWATHKAAEYACKHWHYSKCLPVPPLVKIGVWENCDFVGVVIFSRGASSNLLKPYGLNNKEGCELTRIALQAHITPVSRIVKIAISLLKLTNKGLKLIISFADPFEKHHGGIYQAGNWIYTGKSIKSIEYMDKNGKKWHSRQVSEKGFNIQQGVVRKTPKPSDCRKIDKPGKHRYLMPLTKDMRKKIMLLSKPYPKACEAGDDPDQGNSGGSTPTHTLHKIP